MKNYLATEQQGIELLYRGDSLDNIPFSDITDYNKFCEELDLIPLSDKTYFSQDFNIPQHYKELDIEQFVHSKLVQRDPDEIGRVEMELAMYKERGLYPILQLLVYIIDTMRQNNLVWGVGRGSSVASYLLYILGVHKVDSHKYELDIKEFLK
jgi:DNA polymerase III alpha subunit|tara:strand:- start:169 stop:627 length:459 start_codon:yes stop_codon:yes gene_type:complete